MQKRSTCASGLWTVVRVRISVDGECGLAWTVVRVRISVDGECGLAWTVVRVRISVNEVFNCTSSEYERCVLPAVRAASGALQAGEISGYSRRRCIAPM
jgi:hypothetical protein